MKIAEGTLHKKICNTQIFLFYTICFTDNEIFERIKVIKLRLNIFIDQAIFLQKMMTRN